MAWREKMGSDSLTKYSKNPKNLNCEGVSSVNRVNSKGSENENTETQCVIDVDGGQDIPYSGPVAVKMKSIILGATVDVILKPDQATVDGVVYSNAELVDLKTRGLTAADLREVHRIKQEFEGAVVPSKEVEKLEPIARW